MKAEASGKPTAERRRTTVQAASRSERTDGKSPQDPGDDAWNHEVMRALREAAEARDERERARAVEDGHATRRETEALMALIESGPGSKPALARGSAASARPALARPAAPALAAASARAQTAEVG